MRRWKVSEAKAKFAELLASCRKSPQIICNRENPVGAVIDMDLFEKAMAARSEEERPSMAQLLSELSAIKESEPSEMVIPPRGDRPNPIEDESDEMALCCDRNQA